MEPKSEKLTPESVLNSLRVETMTAEMKAAYAERNRAFFENQRKLFIFNMDKARKEFTS